MKDCKSINEEYMIRRSQK